MLNTQIGKLPNRCQFKERYQQLLRVSKSDWALCLLDLDDFKEINEIDGPAVGDEILIKIADKLCLEPGYWARTGGDSFGLLIEMSSNQIPEISQKILDLIQEAVKPIIHREVTASLGWATFPEDACDFEHMFLYAELALAEAKKDGKNSYRVYKGEIAERAIKSKAIRSNFAVAVASESICFFLQPQADLSSGKIDGAEMLVRWRRPDGNIKFPREFMPIVENNPALVRGLGILGLQEAHRLRVKAGSSYGFSVNIGATHLLHIDFLSDIKEHCPEGEGITIEITESAPIVNIQKAKKV